MGDRDREAAVDLASEFFVDFGPNDERWHDLFKDRMSAIVAKARAEGAASERAAATAACAEVAEDACDDPPHAVADRIRALSPEGWVGVRREDLAALLGAVDRVVTACDGISWDTEPRELTSAIGALGDASLAPAIRAARARGRGESDG